MHLRATRGLAKGAVSLATYRAALQRAVRYSCVVGVCLLVGGATRIVTQVAVYNFYNEACSACGVLAAPIVTRHLHGCRIICGRGSPPPSVWLGSPVRVPDGAYFFRILVVKDARCVSLRVDASLCLYLGAPPLPG